jgi:hypothetical protein
MSLLAPERVALDHRIGAFGVSELCSMPGSNYLPARLRSAGLP